MAAISNQHKYQLPSPISLSFFIIALDYFFCRSTHESSCLHPLCFNSCNTHFINIARRHILAKLFFGSAISLPQQHKIESLQYVDQTPPTPLTLPALEEWFNTSIPLSCADHSLTRDDAL